jgi:hypothetical protein
MASLLLVFDFADIASARSKAQLEDNYLSTVPVLPAKTVQITSVFAGRGQTAYLCRNSMGFV